MAGLWRAEHARYRQLLAEMALVLDTEERHLLPGDVVVQRGTNHAWANRSDRPCRIAFVLLDGVYDPVIAAQLGVAKA